ncbi:ABC transporter substrate-binding protein [Deinococcus sp. HMF7620]|uniref:ABC transporter substrate-binding protein n=1 Tax=Deinococcus arboris TaxID=2682977 RepID=A0A7C9LR00_9DEIO|nr:ABC transporter substrate-binding protein [Deinococcus arboris]MVN87001.1 ABC transporter substrate-binding protein [Deinococcus arboris]
MTRVRLASYVLFTSGCLAAAGAWAAGSFPLAIKHSLGTLAFQKTPARVVTLSEEQAELLSVLGIKAVGFGSGRVEGRLGQPAQNLSTLAKGSLQSAVFVGAYNQPSAELMTALKPDLILMDGEESSRATYDTIRKYGPTLAYNYDTLPWRTALSELGRLFGKSAQAQRYLQTYDARIATLKAQLAAVSKAAPNTTLLYMYEPNSIMVLGRGFSFSRNLATLGLTLNTPAGIDPSISFKQLNTEELLTLKTDRVLILRRLNNGQMVPRNATDEVLKRLGKPVFTYPLDPQEASSGPLTDLKRAEALAKLIRR